MKKTKLSGWIDRFEGEHAVILLDGSQEQTVVLRSALPPEAKEGQRLKNGKLDLAETKAVKKRMRSLMDELLALPDKPAEK